MRVQPLSLLQQTNRIALPMALLVAVGCSDSAVPTAAAPKRSVAAAANSGGTNSVVNYDSKSLAEYQTKWANPYGQGELAAGGTLTQKQNGEVTVSAVPFHVGADYSVYDHLKYIAISTQSFNVPQVGSLEFSVRINASTPGAISGRVIHGCYGGPGSFVNVNDPCTQPWSAPALEGQQAGVVLNMINFATGQLFDWFVSDNEVFALIERLPTSVTGSPGTPITDAYTQIVKVAKVSKAQEHHVAIRYSRGLTLSRVEYFLDGKLFASVDNVGVPLDVQLVPFTGIYPSLGGGTALKDHLNSFQIGHGLFSLLDVFPFQDFAAPSLSVSVPMSERLFGQGATGAFKQFQVTTR